MKYLKALGIYIGVMIVVVITIAVLLSAYRAGEYILPSLTVLAEVLIVAFIASKIDKKGLLSTHTLLVTMLLLAIFYSFQLNSDRSMYRLEQTFFGGDKQLIQNAAYQKYLASRSYFEYFIQSSDLFIRYMALGINIGTLALINKALRENKNNSQEKKTTQESQQAKVE